MFLTPTLLGDLQILAILGLIGAHSLRLYQTGRWMLLDPLNAFWGGVLVCYIQQPIRGADIYIGWHSPAIFHKTLLAITIGLLFVILGYETQIGPKLAARIPKLPPHLNSERLLFSGWALIVAGVAGYAYLMRASGGAAQWLSAARGGTDYNAVRGYIPELVQALPVGISLLLLRANMHRITLSGRLLAWGLGALMWLWFLYLGTRLRVITFAFVMIAAYYLPRRKNPSIAFTAILYFSIQISVNFLGYRDNFTNLSFNLQEIDSTDLRKKVLPVFLGGDNLVKREEIDTGAEFNCVMSTIELVPDSVPFNYGYGHLEVFTRPIPRSVWPDKPYPHIESVQGVLRGATLSYSTVISAQNRELLMGPAFTFAGHWYYAGGYLGLALGGILTGVLLRTIRSFYDFNTRNQSALILFPSLIGIGFLEAAFTPLYWIFSLPFVIMPLLLVFYWSRELPAIQRTTSRFRRNRKAHAFAARYSSVSEKQ